ncbi:hypothetical protein [uncultured Helicobacter sp.]
MFFVSPPQCSSCSSLKSLFTHYRWRTFSLVALCFFVFVLALGLRWYHIHHKNGFHVDETLSVSISNVSGYVWGKTLPNGEFFGKELKEMVYWNNPTLSDAWQDIQKLWQNNNWDLAHP